MKSGTCARRTSRRPLHGPEVGDVEGGRGGEGGILRALLNREEGGASRPVTLEEGRIALWVERSYLDSHGAK